MICVEFDWVLVLMNEILPPVDVQLFNTFSHSNAFFSINLPYSPPAKVPSLCTPPH